MIRPDSFSPSLEGAMNGIGIKTQEACACSCFQSHGKPVPAPKCMFVI